MKPFKNSCKVNLGATIEIYETSQNISMDQNLEGEQNPLGDDQILERANKKKEVTIIRLAPERKKVETGCCS